MLEEANSVKGCCPGPLFWGPDQPAHPSQFPWVLEYCTASLHKGRHSHSYPFSPKCLLSWIFQKIPLSLYLVLITLWLYFLSLFEKILPWVNVLCPALSLGFPCANSFNSDINPTEWVSLSCPIFRGENGGTEGLSNLPHVTAKKWQSQDWQCVCRALALLRYTTLSLIKGCLFMWSCMFILREEKWQLLRLTTSVAMCVPHQPKPFLEFNIRCFKRLSWEMCHGALPQEYKRAQESSGWGAEALAWWSPGNNIPFLESWAGCQPKAGCRPGRPGTSQRKEVPGEKK